MGNQWTIGKTAAAIFAGCFTIIVVLSFLCAPEEMEMPTEQPSIQKSHPKPDTTQYVPPQYVNNQPDMVILDHSTPEAQANGTFGLLDREWPTQVNNGRLYWQPDCYFLNQAQRRGNTDSTKYDFVLFRHLEEYEGLLTSGIYDTLGNLESPAYKVDFDFSPEPYLPNFGTKDYISLGYMAINWGCTDEYTDPQDITGLYGAHNFKATFNSGKIFKEQNYQNNTIVYPMFIDSTGVHLRK